MIKKKGCENCAWYQPLDTFGLCEREDGRVNADPRFHCKFWCGIKYDRRNNKKMLRMALKESATADF